MLFNCPEWGIATSRITIHTSQVFHRDYSRFKDIDPTFTSCDSLVRVCMPIDTENTQGTLRFDPPPGSNWTHLAEVTFYTDTSTCPPDTVLNHNPIPSLSPSTAAVTTDTTQGATDHTTPGDFSHAPTGSTGHTHPDHTPLGDVNHTSTGDTIQGVLTTPLSPPPASVKQLSVGRRVPPHPPWLLFWAPAFPSSS